MKRRKGNLLVEGALAMTVLAAGLGMWVEAAAWQRRRDVALEAAQGLAHLAARAGVTDEVARRETERFLARVARESGTSWQVSLSRPTSGAAAFYPLIAGTVRFEHRGGRGVWPAQGEETVVIAKEDVP